MQACSMSEKIMGAHDLSIIVGRTRRSTKHKEVIADECS